jgi:hypothetical protein
MTDKRRDETVTADSLPSPASRYSAMQFLICFVLFLGVSPVFDDFQQGTLIETVLLSLVLLSAIVAAGGRRRTVVIASALAVPAILGKWLHQFHPDVIPIEPVFVIGMVFAGFIVGHHFLYIVRSREVDSQVLSAGISTYLMLGLLWAFGYLLLDNLSPHSFTIHLEREGQTQLNSFAAIYFSLGTMSGLGIADVAPASDVARMLALLQSLVAVFYLAIFISCLVSMHMAGRATSDSAGADSDSR